MKDLCPYTLEMEEPWKGRHTYSSDSPDVCIRCSTIDWSVPVSLDLSPSNHAS